MLPQAFLSYTRKDDEFFGGYITAFRKMLENAVHVVSGEETFRVFQDIEGIVIGENWQKALSQAIHESSFFVPMLSPLFFNSEPCRAEVTEFLAHERALKRAHLILPIYFLTSPKLEKEEEKGKDPIATELAARQLFDWRKKANLPLQEPAAREAILELASAIVASLARLGGTGAQATTARSPAEPPTGAGDADATLPEVARPALAAPAAARLVTGVDGRIRREEPNPRKVLWVDDKPENNLWERRSLESYGVKVTLALDTAEAKKLMSAERDFAAIISDMGRPGDREAGMTLWKWMREDLERETPYFIYTSVHGANRAARSAGPSPRMVTADPDALVGGVLAALE